MTTSRPWAETGDVSSVGAGSKGLDLPMVRVACPSCAGSNSKFERILQDHRLERCSECGLVYVNPRPTEAALTSLYLRKDAEAQARFYSRTVSPAQLWEYDRILSDISSLVTPPARLVDVGCAAGYFMERATHAGFDAHGVDLAVWVRQITTARGIQNVRVGRLADAGFETGWADAVHASQVFEHLPDPAEELAEIRRILKPGGALYLNVPNYRCFSIVVGRDDFELNLPPEHVTYFTPRTLANLLRANGFDVIRTATYGGVKWENLLGRPISSEIAEAARAGGDPAEAPSVQGQTIPERGFVSRLVRKIVYDRLQWGMTLEVFARRP
jgi:SAM-dependent methyltransferase